MDLPDSYKISRVPHYSGFSFCYPGSFDYGTFTLYSAAFLLASSTPKV